MKHIKRFQIGKKGLTKEFIEQLKKTFENKDTERVKIDILKSACRNKKEAREIGNRILEEMGRKYQYKLVGYVLTLMRFRKQVR